MGKSFIDKVLELDDVKRQRDELMQAGRRFVASDQRKRRREVLTRALFASVRDMALYKWTDNRADNWTDDRAGEQTSEQTTEQITEQLSRQSTEQLSRQSTGQTTEQISEQTSGQTRPYFQEQIKTLRFFIDHPRVFLSMPELARKTGVSYGTIRRHIKKFEAYGCLAVTKRHQFGKQGKEYIADVDACRKHLEQITEQTSEQISEQTTGHEKSSYGAIEDSSSYSYKNLILYPCLLDQFSFRQSHIDQVIVRRKEKGISLDDLQDSLWVINELLKDREYLREQGIEKPRAYFLKALENGPVDLPEGYKTVYERQRERQKKRVEAARREKFLAWKESLGEDELEEICSQGRGPREQWLWYYFTRYVDPRNL